MPVRLHVIGVDVGDDRNHRREIQKRGIGLVGLDHNEVARSKTRIGPGGIQTAANDESRVHAPLGQNRGHQTGRRRLAVRPGNGDPLLEPHQLGEHLRTRHDRHLARARRPNFRVVFLDRRRHHHSIGILHILGNVSGSDPHAKPRQPTRRRIVSQVRAAHAEAQVVQHLGDPTHARPTNSDEVDIFDFVFHLTNSSHWRATSATASGLASARARSAICNN